MPGLLLRHHTKHPDVDHDAELASARAAAAAAGARFWTTDCLGRCERSNVVVVRAGGSRRWFGEMLAGPEVDALAAWITGGARSPVPPRLSVHEFDPDLDVPVVARRLPWEADAIADLVHGVLIDAIGGWSLGVEGAAIELGWEDAPPAVVRAGRTIQAMSSTGGLGVDVTDATALFAFDGPGVVIALVLAVPRSGLAPSATVLWSAAPIQAPSGPSTPVRRWSIWASVTPAAESFCVRADDAELCGQLDATQGTPFADLLDTIAPLLVERSPHRVVETAIGRAEVSGLHAARRQHLPKDPTAHLLPDGSSWAKNCPDGVALPPGWAPAALFHPPPGWSLPAL